MLRHLASLFAVAALLPWGSSELAAQRSPRVPVTIVLVDSLPVPGAPFLIQRRPDLAPNDVILLPTSSTEPVLSEAIRTLMLVRQAGGDFPTERRTLRIRPGQARPASPRDFPWVPRVLADLRRATPKAVAGVGTVKAVQIWLPQQQVRRPAGGSRSS